VEDLSLFFEVIFAKVLIIIKKYKIKITRAKETFEPILVDEFESEKLRSRCLPCPSGKKNYLYCWNSF